MAVATLPVGLASQELRRRVIASLAVLMTAATGAAVLAAGWTAASWLAVAVGVAGALEAAAIVLLVKRGRLLAVVLPPLLLVGTLAVAFLGSVPVPPHSGPTTVVGSFADAAVTGLLGNGSWTFNVGLGTLLWAGGAWSVERALSGRRGTVATAPCWAILAVNVINSPSPNQAALASSLAAVTAILLIAAVQLERLTAGWSRGGLRVLPGTDSRFALAGAAGGILVLLLAVALPPLTSSDISGRIFNVAGNSAGGGGPGSSHGAGVGRAGTVRFDPATVPGGALTLSGTQVLTYRTSSATGVYLHMATDAIFDGGNWLPATLNDNVDLASETAPAGQIPRDRLVADGGVGGSVGRVSMNVTLADDTSGSNLLPFPGEPDGASVSARVDGVQVPDSLQGLVTVDSASALDLIVGRLLVTSGTQSTATPEQLRAAGSSYPTFIERGGYLQLRDDGTGGAKVIATLAQQWTRNATNPYDKASAIETTLRNPALFHYALDPPLASPVQQVWPITYFLTTSHTGYCQYFAASMGAMLRALGIPARLVNGYGPGTAPDSATRANPNATWRVTSNDAHTWVEAYFPGYGWIPFEPTPPSQAGDYQTFPRGGAPPSLPGATAAPSRAPATRAPATRTPAPAAAAPTGSGDDGQHPPAALTTTLTVIVAIVLLVLVFAAWFLRPRGITGIWRRVGLVGRLVGIPRLPSMTLSEYAVRVTGLLPADTIRFGHARGDGPVGPRPLRRRVATALAEIAAVTDLQLYGNQPLHPRDTMRMRRAWRRVARWVPALGWRVLLRRVVTP